MADRDKYGYTGTDAALAACDYRRTHPIKNKVSGYDDSVKLLASQMLDHVTHHIHGDDGFKLPVVGANLVCGVWGCELTFEHNDEGCVERLVLLAYDHQRRIFVDKDGRDISAVTIDKLGGKVPRVLDKRAGDLPEGIYLRAHRHGQGTRGKTR